MSNKKLYKSSVNRMLCGVCGGIAEYFNIDPTLVRLVWVIITLMAEPESWRISLRAIISRLKMTVPIKDGHIFQKPNFSGNCPYSIKR